MLKMLYFQQVMRTRQFLKNDIMLGITAGARKKGKPHVLLMDDITS